MGRAQVMAAAILGAWIVSTPCMWFAATRSFATVDSILKNPPPRFVEITKPLSPESTRMVLRHTASEINRSLFWGYGPLQVALGVVLLLLLRGQKARNHVDLGIVVGMLAVAVLLTAVITPLIIATGRNIDFLPRNPPPPIMPRFWALHGSFTGLDGAKLLAGIVLLFRWILRTY